MSLASIVQLFRAHKGKEQFAHLLRPHIELMYRMAYRWTRSQEDAEDLVQDVLIKLANRVEEMLAVEQLRPWLIKVVYRRFVDLYRREQASPLVQMNQDADESSLIEQAAAAEDIAGSLEQQQLLAAALDALDDDHRDVILLYGVEGYTALEIAEILDLNVGTVKSRLQRARERLKKFLQPGPF
jgi:RNA polymerase sigma-70 factor (ECF subfamily)